MPKQWHHFPSIYFSFSYLLFQKKSENKVGKISHKPRKQSNKLSYNETRELEQLEIELEKINYRLKELERRITEDAANLSHTDFAEITAEQNRLQNELDEKELRWLELDEKKSS